MTSRRSDRYDAPTAASLYKCPTLLLLPRHSPLVFVPNQNLRLAIRSSCMQFTLQPSLDEGAPGSNAGECDIQLREAAMPVGVAYNEVEEDADGNGMTADAARLGVSGGLRVWPFQYTVAIALAGRDSAWR